MKTLSPIKVHGGKTYQAKEIRKLFPKHTHYGEAYFGGGSVLFSGTGVNVAEFANDLNGELMNFWKVLRGEFSGPRFIKTIYSVPFSQDEFKAAAKVKGCDAMERAVAFFVRNRQSRQGLGKDFATPTTRLRQGMNEQVSAWLSAVDNLLEFTERLRRVELRNQPAVDFIEELDHKNFFVYADPPYMKETRTAKEAYGEFEMNWTDHDILLNVLSAMKGKFLLSGYRSELYDNYADGCGWKRIDRVIDNKASSSKTKTKMVECLWKNY